LNEYLDVKYWKGLPMNDFMDFPSEEAALDFENESPIAEPIKFRFYCKDGKYIGCAYLDGIDEREFPEWFTAAKESNETIDAESLLVPFEDENKGNWHLGYQDPKSTGFKGHIL